MAGAMGFSCFHIGGSNLDVHLLWCTHLSTAFQIVWSLRLQQKLTHLGRVGGQPSPHLFFLVWQDENAHFVATCNLGSITDGSLHQLRHVHMHFLDYVNQQQLFWIGGIKNPWVFEALKVDIFNCRMSKVGANRPNMSSTNSQNTFRYQRFKCWETRGF